MTIGALVGTFVGEKAGTWMKILYLHQYFQTPKRGTVGIAGTRSYEFAKRFVAAGHEVEVVCSWVRPDPGTPVEWRVTNEDGIRVHWLQLAYANRMGFAERLRSFSRFALAATQRVRMLKADVVYATSTPLSIAVPGLYASFHHKVPLVFEVRDLWPEAPRQMGVLTNPLLFAAARQLELATYRNARHIIGLSPGMCEGILATGQPASKVSMIPNACDLDLFHPGVDGTNMRQKLGLGDRFTFAYFGTMGPANGLDFVLRAAEILQRRGRSDIVFLLHGDGKCKPDLRREAHEKQLTNVVFSDPFEEKARIAEIAAAADVCMTIYKNVPVCHMCSPNKFFDGLAAGRPILTNMPGWLTSIVEDNACGVGVVPDDAEDFADKAERLTSDREQLATMGRNSRRVAERDFSRDRLALQVLDILEDAAGVSRTPTVSSAAAAAPV